jgi:signal transduction histidine kinase
VRPSAVELRGFEQDLLAAREQLRNFVLAQERFVANVSHEINTPIAVILTEAQTLKRESLGEEAREFVDSVREEMRRLARTMDGFLMLARLRTGREEVRALHCDVNELVTEAVAACTVSALQYEVRIEAILAEGEPRAVVAGEPTLLRAMLEHLVRNAIKYSKRGGKVEAQVKVKGGECLVMVCDGGEHIAPEELEGLFAHYASEPGKSGRGRGLGLAVAQGLAELHRGRIVASNRDEPGCLFTVHLPMPKAAAPANSRIVNGVDKAVSVAP